MAKWWISTDYCEKPQERIQGWKSEQIKELQKE